MKNKHETKNVVVLESERKRKIMEGRKTMEKGERFLPIGTVVMLEKGKKRVMITGFCAVTKDNKDKIWDYSGCMYPEGFLDSEHICLFDHSQIDKIYYLGLSDDDEEKAFKTKLNEIAKKL